MKETGSVAANSNGNAEALLGRITALEQALQTIASNGSVPDDTEKTLGDLGLSALLHSVGIQVALKQSLSKEMVEGSEALAKRRNKARRKGLKSLLKAAKDEDVQSLTGVYLEGSSLDDEESLSWFWGKSDYPVVEAAKDVRESHPSSNADILLRADESPTTFAEQLNARSALETELKNLLKNEYQLQPDIDFKIEDGKLTDLRRCRLYIKLDLSEWLQIKNCDILHVVDEEPGEADGYAPLGRTTVWVYARAQVKHVRSKTAKTFIRGQIAEQLRIEDLESNVSGFVNKIFDTDSELAYSSTNAPC